MPESLFPEMLQDFSSTRRGALRELQAFIPVSGRYGRDRNHVVPGHTNVSRLSPAIRHRLILESECAAAPLQRYAASTVEKFTQEVYWRRYWKSWLSLRPQVWSGYLKELDELRSGGGDSRTMERVACCEAGEGPVAIMNHFARELVETGYLHNHARMWFAGWWVHVERLPWQLGADFFYRHLLDGDPASNTLSWRWVAGLQTAGKAYLPRRSNLERYLPAELLAEHADGLEQLEHPSAIEVSQVARPEITRAELPEPVALARGRIGIWIHEEDLLIEKSPLADFKPVSILAAGDVGSWHRFAYPGSKVEWLRSALGDASERAAASLGADAEIRFDGTIHHAVLDWAKKHRVEQVVAMRPDVGPLHDQVAELRLSLQEEGIDLQFYDRQEDLELRPFATGGFFGFWKKIQRKTGQAGPGGGS